MGAACVRACRFMQGYIIRLTDFRFLDLNLRLRLRFRAFFGES